MLIHQTKHESFERVPPELLNFARRQYVNATMYKGDQRRRVDRQPMILSVRAVEVDAEGTPIGQPFDLVTRDISPTSVGLIHTDLILAEHLAIQMNLSGDEVVLQIELLWSGEMGPFYGAAGKYVRRLSEFPATPDWE